MLSALIPGPHLINQRLQPSKLPALHIRREYRAGIYGGWSCWMQAYPPATSSSSSSSHHKSQPCIPSEYVGLVFLRAGAAGLLGVALV